VLQREVVSPSSTTKGIAARSPLNTDRLRRTKSFDSAEEVRQDDIDGDGKCIDGNERHAKLEASRHSAWEEAEEQA